ncbi:uncharacterized protein BP5553_09799 [Venustampulla echinocandica]|uniref:2-(3-amino-3-carboxypropyl)histidine synthase subunit 2 n=1 Tax=Venustampulla echinocandica TaxID=2656787 RepID=A0A370TAP7_9HELO|nr:uncharacterized protein BP5553_09799 [Venustampulla echinocandica]RDL31010.1 hypothetical protein BP5553_09799 [Venustampulla echinocandica]
MAAHQPIAPPVLSTPETHLFSDPTPLAIPTKESRLSNDEIRETYEIERTAREIIQGAWRRVALQFPDEMLVDAPRVFEGLASELENLSQEGGEEGNRSTRRRLYILADTSYGCCCVDEIAAEHVDAEVVVHYGRACLSPTARLPVLYVFTSRKLDADDAASGFEESFDSKEEKVIMMADLTYQSHVKPLVERLRKSGWKNVRETAVIHDPVAEIPNRKIVWEEGEEGKEPLQEWRIWHISDPPPALLLTLSSRIKELLIYPTTASTSPSKPGPKNQIIRSNTTAVLRRRYALLTRLTTVPIIGILINTLSVANYLSSTGTLQAMISRAGKKSYTFVVGKVNAAKMANFSEVGAWVVLGCWESSLLEGDFYAPVVTPFELELALQKDGERVWSGEWRGDFESVLWTGGTSDVVGNGGEKKEVDDGSLIGEKQQQDDEDNDESEEESQPPEFDLRTGRYVSHSRPMFSSSTSASTTTTTPSSSDPPTSKVLARRAKGDLATVNGAVSPGAEFLRSQRTWTGLGSDFNDEGDGDGDSAGRIEEGRGGIARGYTVGGEGVRR